MRHKTHTRPTRKAKGSRIEWSGPRPVGPPKRGELIPVWKDPVIEAAVKTRATPASYQRPPEVTDELIESLVNGGAVIAKHDLMLGEKGVYPFAALQRFYGPVGAPVPVPCGSLLMYAGVLRSTERKWLDGGGHADVQVFKHTFITPHGRCIIHDFSLIRPA
jgi:hypothetical protein